MHSALFRWNLAVTRSLAEVQHYWTSLKIYSHTAGEYKREPPEPGTYRETIKGSASLWLLEPTVPSVPSVSQAVSVAILLPDSHDTGGMGDSLPLPGTPRVAPIFTIFELGGWIWWFETRSQVAQVALYSPSKCI